VNARIIELAKKSGIDVYGLGKDREKWEQRLEEFAKLIADECSQIAMNQHNSDSFDSYDDLDYYDRFLDDTALKISREILNRFL
jgi:hypothetical protein